MSLSQLVLLALLACLSVTAAGAAPGRGALLHADFEQDPKKAGWEAVAPKGKKFRGAWAEADANSTGRYLTVEEGHWHSPALPVRPLAYYRLRFRAKARSDGYWAAMFHDAAGKLLDADCYDSLPGSRDWRPHEYCFRAAAGAAAVRIRFQPRMSAVAVDDARVEGVSRRAAAEWADRVYAAVPPLAYAPPKRRGKLLPNTTARLRSGPSLRIVLLGDSIANDTANSAFDVLLERACPKCRIDVVSATRGGTGCDYYSQDNRVAEHVLAHRPDLLVIAGISNGFHTDAVRSVIRQVRAKSDCEIALMTGTICPEERCETAFIDSWHLPREEASKIVEEYPARLAGMADEEKVELLDVRTPWDDYVRHSGQPHAWYMRDPIHANTRGKHVLGRILLRYFQPRGQEGD
jgi:lysophospholipase L1-like esterase